MRVTLGKDFFELGSLIRRLSFRFRDLEIAMVLLSPDWIASKIQTTPEDGRRSRSSLAFALLAVVLLSGLAALSMAFGVGDPAIFAAP